MKLTPWFAPGTDPVHVGPYRTRIASLTVPAYQFWNGKFWGAYCFSPAKALEARDFRSAYQHRSWRGLAEEPKA